MNQNQLKQIKDFSRKFYTKTGKYHGWDHILLTHHHALKLAKGYKKINKGVLEAACFLHDIGRVKKDEGHSLVSVRMAVPFLKKINIPDREIETITEAVGNHDKDKIEFANSLESKILFDADKLQILSVFGFTRALVWLVEERKMNLNKAVEFLWEYCQEVRKKHMYTRRAKRIVDKEFKILKVVVDSYFKWQNLGRI